MPVDRLVRGPSSETLYNSRPCELAEARSLVGDDRYSSTALLRAVGSWGVPMIRALVESTYFPGLRKAGVPEE